MESNDYESCENLDWAYPLLRLLVIGTLFEIGCTGICVLLARAGFVSESLRPLVEYFVFGAAISAAWSTIAILWYLRIRRNLIDDQGS